MRERYGTGALCALVLDLAFRGDGLCAACRAGVRRIAQHILPVLRTSARVFL